MARTEKVGDSDRAGYTRAEKRLIALAWALAGAVVVLLMRR